MTPTVDDSMDFGLGSHGLLAFNPERLASQQASHYQYVRRIHARSHNRDSGPQAKSGAEGRVARCF